MDSLPLSDQFEETLATGFPHADHDDHARPPASKRPRVIDDDLEISSQFLYASTEAGAFTMAALPVEPTHFPAPPVAAPVAVSVSPSSEAVLVEFDIVSQPQMRSLKQRSRITPAFQVRLRVPEGFECLNDAVHAQLADGTSPELVTSFRLLSAAAPLQSDSSEPRVGVASFHSLTFEQGSRQMFVRLQFHATLRQLGSGLLLPIHSAPSEPFIVCTHTLQWSAAELATLRRIAFEVAQPPRDSVSWAELRLLLQRHFALATGLERPLSDADLQYIHQHLLASQDAIGVPQFEAMWRWYGSALKQLVGKPGRSLWERKFLWGFHSAEQLRQILLQQHLKQPHAAAAPLLASSSASSRQRGSLVSANGWLSASAVCLFAIDDQSGELCAFCLHGDAYQLVRAEVASAKLSLVVAVLENTSLSAVLHPEHPDSPLLKDRALRDLRPKGSSSSSAAPALALHAEPPAAAMAAASSSSASSGRKRRESDADSSAAGSPRFLTSVTLPANAAPPPPADEENYAPVYDDHLL